MHPRAPAPTPGPAVRPDLPASSPDARVGGAQQPVPDLPNPPPGRLAPDPGGGGGGPWGGHRDYGDPRPTGRWRLAGGVRDESHFRHPLPDRDSGSPIHRAPSLRRRCGGRLGGTGSGCADLLVSGIPLSGLSRSMRRDMLAGWRRVLRPGGVLVVYQFTRSALPDLKHLFGQVRQEFEPLNVLPARVFRCVRLAPPTLAPFEHSSWPGRCGTCPIAGRLFGWRSARASLSACSASRRQRSPRRRRASSTRRRRSVPSWGIRGAAWAGPTRKAPRAIRARSPACTSKSPRRGALAQARDPVRAQGRTSAGRRGGRRHAGHRHRPGLPRVPGAAPVRAPLGAVPAGALRRACRRPPDRVRPAGHRPLLPLRAECNETDLPAFRNSICGWSARGWRCVGPNPPWRSRPDTRRAPVGFEGSDVRNRAFGVLLA